MPLERSGGKKDWARPSKAKEVHGKRKGQISSPSASFPLLWINPQPSLVGLGLRGLIRRMLKVWAGLAKK